jgi:hypothetical protein
MHLSTYIVHLTEEINSNGERNSKVSNSGRHRTGEKSELYPERALGGFKQEVGTVWSSFYKSALWGLVQQYIAVIPDTQEAEVGRS